MTDETKRPEPEQPEQNETPGPSPEEKRMLQIASGWYESKQARIGEGAKGSLDDLAGGLTEEEQARLEELLARLSDPKAKGKRETRREIAQLLGMTRYDEGGPTKRGTYRKPQQGE
jgi:hypothetical protein